MYLYHVSAKRKAITSFISALGLLKRNRGTKCAWSNLQNTDFQTGGVKGGSMHRHTSTACLDGLNHVILQHNKSCVQEKGTTTKMTGAIVNNTWFSCVPPVISKPILWHHLNSQGSYMYLQWTLAQNDIQFNGIIFARSKYHLLTSS